VVTATLEVETWPELDQAAYHGTVGEFVSAVEEHTEADPAALTFQLLIAFGNCAGRSPHQMIGPTRHGLNNFVALVGETAKGRKGTSEAYVRSEMRDADPDWARNCIKGGVVSGEGIIYHLRDPNPLNETDPGVSEKRLQLIESEFATLLKATERQQNTSSEVLRQAWDGQILRTLAKNSPLQASDTHVSVITHITLNELRRNLTSTQQANGFGNRFLWALVRRSKELPIPTEPDRGTMQRIAASITAALSAARRGAQFDFNDAARELWVAEYHELSAARPGLLGGITGRAEAHVRRLAAIYAALDSTCAITAEHLRAALAIWKYAAVSAEQIFGDALGDPAADGILSALRMQSGGLTRTEITNLFSRHLSGAAIEAALLTLISGGLANFVTEKTRGRSTERWFAAVEKSK
jgi:Protein of unknown function (DUF3987)